MINKDYLSGLLIPTTTLHTLMLRAHSKLQLKLVDTRLVPTLFGQDSFCSGNFYELSFETAKLQRASLNKLLFQTIEYQSVNDHVFQVAVVSYCYRPNLKSIYQNLLKKYSGERLVLQNIRRACQSMKFQFPSSHQELSLCKVALSAKLKNSQEIKLLIILCEEQPFQNDQPALLKDWNIVIKLGRFDNQGVKAQVNFETIIDKYLKLAQKVDLKKERRVLVGQSEQGLLLTDLSVQAKIREEMAQLFQI